jgi:transposase
MANVQNFTGIDISKMSFDVTYEANGKPRTKKFAYTPEGMESCLSYLPESTHCVMESTGTYHLRLATLLYERGIAVSVVNPLSAKNFSRSMMLRAKTDKADSWMLMEYGKALNPRRWEVSEACYVEIRQLSSLSEQLIREEGMLCNQLEAIGHSVIRSAFAIAKIEERILQLQKDRQQIEDQMESLMLSQEKETFKRLTDIPGIGKKTAILLLALTDGMKRFESAKQLSSYLGLCPRICLSGTSVKGKGRICKMGMSSIRKLLYMCALSAKKYNSACRELYERLLSNGKAKRQALIAVANKLLRQCFHIVKHNHTYVDGFGVKNTCTH